MTLHGSKGLEFPVVFVSGIKSGKLPLESTKHPADIQEERRLFYVGMTRAREELVLTYGAEPSPFISELPDIIKKKTIKYREQPVDQSVSYTHLHNGICEVWDLAEYFEVTESFMRKAIHYLSLIHI